MTEPTPTTAPSTDDLDPERFAELATGIEREVGAFIVGQHHLVRQTLISLLAGSHALLEGVPGLGKTMLVRTLAEALDLGFSRIQFTPDLMPADIVGTNIIVEEGGERRFRFQQGPIFSNLVLADEINRATPKTQSALLEAMQEHRVTVAKQQYTLSEPFFVLATQNPLEMEGTYPLPEAQLDRFFFKIDVPFPSEEDLVRIMERTTGVEQPTVGKAATGAEVRGDAAPGARRPDRLARDGLCDPHPARDASRYREGAGHRSLVRPLRRFSARRAGDRARGEDPRPPRRPVQRGLLRCAGRGRPGAAPSGHPELRG